MGQLVEFCVREGTRAKRGNWGVFKIFVLGKRLEREAEGVFPVTDADDVVPGTTFFAEGVEIKYQNKPRLKLQSIRPRDPLSWGDRGRR